MKKDSFSDFVQKLYSLGELSDARRLASSFPTSTTLDGLRIMKPGRAHMLSACHGRDSACGMKSDDGTVELTQSTSVSYKITTLSRRQF